MASILECFLEKSRRGYVTTKSVARLRQQVDSLFAQGKYSEYKAAEEVLNEAETVLQNRLTATLKQADLIEKHLDVLDAALERGVPAKVALRAMSLGDEAHTFKYGHIARSARETVEAYQGYFLSKATDAFNTLMPKGFFRFDRSPEFDKEVIRELFNIVKKVDDASISKGAKETAKVIDDLHMFGGKLFQKSGGNVRLMEGHALGDTADIAKITQLGADDWIKLASTVYDRDFFAKITGMDVTDDVWHFALLDTYNAKVSGGLSRFGNWVPGGLRTLLNSRSYHRAFRFIDANSYIRYHEQLGGIDLYTATKRYAESIGRDIGIMEALGTKPQSLENALLRHIGATDPETAKDVAGTFARDLRYVTKSYTGSTSDSMDKWLGTVGALRVAGSLGTTVVDAASTEKLGLSKIATTLRGLPLLQTLQQDLKATFASGAKKEVIFKDLAEQALHLEAYIDESAGTLRAHMSDGGHNFARKAAHLVTKSTGLVRMTNGTRAGSVRSLSIEIGERSWEEVSSNFKEYFTKLGLTKDMFYSIKKHGSSPMAEMENISGVSVGKLFDAGKTEEAIALSALVNRITEASAPTRSPRWLSALDELARQGKAQQFLSTSLRTFSGYPTSFWDNHIRVLANVPGAGKKAAYLGAYVTVLGTLGTVVVMIKDVLNGKRPDLSEKTVLRAFGRSGIIPIISDFMLAPSQGNSVGDIASRTAGANFGTVFNLIAGTKSAIEGTIEGRGPGAGLYQIQRSLYGLMPGQNFPVVGLILHRLILDQLRYFYDSQAGKKFAKTAKEATKEGTPYLWKPGKLTPE